SPARASLAALAILLVAAAAEASPSRWARARNPALDQQENVLAEVEALELRYKRVTRLQKDAAAAEVGKIYLRPSRDMLEPAGPAARPPGAAGVRLRRAELPPRLGEAARAAPLFGSITRDKPSVPVLLDTYSALAISYARLGRHEEEIKAYGEALRLEPHSW